MSFILDLNMATFWTIVMLIIFPGFIYVIFIRESRIDRMMRKFPGYKDFPIIGHVYKFSNPEDSHRVFHGWLSKYGGRCRVYFGTSFKTLMVSRPKDLEKVLTSQELLNKSPFYDLMKSWIGEGVLTSSGERWRKHRKLLAPAFHVKILENFQPIFHENSKVLVKILKHLSEEEVEIHGLISRCTLDVICETIMGKKLRCQLDPENKFLKATQRVGELVWMRMMSPWYSNSFIWNLSKFSAELEAALHSVHSFSHQVIKERREYFSRLNSTVVALRTQDDSRKLFSNSKKRFAFLDLLLSHETSGELTEKDVQEEADTFMFAGQDTTATALSWTIYLLGWHKSRQAILHEELDSIFGEDKSRPIEPGDLPKLKYLEMCIKEGQRLYPPAPIFSRIVENDFQLDENSIVPKGAIIFMNIYSAHRNPECFPQPEEFKPERFTPENRSKIHPFAFVPFSSGPRNCIGQKFGMAKVKTILANLFRNFKVESLDPPDKVIAVVETTLKAKNPGLRVKFIPR